MASSTLLDDILRSVTPELVSRASSLFGESEGALSKGVTAAASSLLMGAVQKSNNTGFIERLLGLANDPALSSFDPASALSSISSGSGPLVDLGSRLLSSLFGANTGAIGDLLARTAGVRPSTASSLLGFIAPLALSAIRGRAQRDGLDAAGLGRWLSSQRDAVAATAPPGLASVLAGETTRRATATAAAPAASSTRWVWPLLLLLGLLGLWALLRRDREPEVARVERPPAAAPLPPVAAPAALARTLPSGYTLQSPPTGLEVVLVEFIENPNRQVDEVSWFDFDRLLFETGSATLKPESRAQLRNVAEVLKAYPSVSVKIGGYTDNQGDPASNQQLSRDRAASVVSELIVLGVAPERLEAEGYGEQHPVADNSTEAGRAQNRRIALRVTKK